MAGATLDRQLTGARTARVCFDIARPSDDVEIRRLFRETPMAGQISISLEREPNYFADAGLAGESKQTIVAYDNGVLACVGSCAIRPRFVNGMPCRVGYLGGLRMDHRYVGRFDIPRRGYQFFRQLQTEAPADFYFTSIASDNDRARRFLERGAAGMPLYEFVGEFITILVSSNRERTKTAVPENYTLSDDPPALAELVAFLNSSNQERQFAPCWSVQELQSLQVLGLQFSDFRIIRKDGNLVACGATWDQQNFKQAVIRGYAPWLKMARPIINATSQVLKEPRLPMIGETLANAFASHFAMMSNRVNEFSDIMNLLLSAAREEGNELLTLGFAANDPLLAKAREIFPCREYRSRLYVVRWPDIGRSAAELDGRPLAPEVALL